MGSILVFWKEFNLEISSGALVGFSERSTEGFPEKELTEKKNKKNSWKVSTGKSWENFQGVSTSKFWRITRKNNMLKDLQDKHARNAARNPGKM